MEIRALQAELRAAQLEAENAIPQKAEGSGEGIERRHFELLERHWRGWNEADRMATGAARRRLYRADEG